MYSSGSPLSSQWLQLILPCHPTPSVSFSYSNIVPKNYTIPKKKVHACGSVLYMYSTCVPVTRI